MPEIDLKELFGTNERRMTLLHHLLASLMIACFMLVIVRMMQAILPTWPGGFLVPLTLLVAIEAMYSQRFAREFDAFSREWFVYRLTEWVVILIGVKLVLYLVNGFDQLWRDIPTWREDFIENFFTGEYLFTVILVLVTAAIAAMFSETLARLEGDEKLLKLERETGITGQRPEARRSLANLILTVGLAMIFLSGLLRMDWEALWGSAPPRWNGGVVVVLVYFALGLVLLSLTQFAVLRVHWSLDRVPFRQDLGRRWLLYSLGFLGAVTLVAALLPTRYSVGLLDVLGYLISALSFLAMTLMMIVLTPVFFLFSLIARLLVGVSDTQLPDLRAIVPPPPSNPGDSSLGELIRSILFWLVFVGVIVFSLRHYLREHGELMGRLRRLPLLGALFNFLRWLGQVGQEARAGLAGRVQAGLDRLRERARQARTASGYLSLRRLTPRQRVLFYYLALVRRGQEAGYPRQPDQTPLEYERELKRRLPELEQELGVLTGDFIEARYSRHEIPAEEAGRVQQLWMKVRKALRRPLK